jgi:hypothetical protein
MDASKPTQQNANIQMEYPTNVDLAERVGLMAGAALHLNPVRCVGPRDVTSIRFVHLVINALMPCDIEIVGTALPVQGQANVRSRQHNMATAFQY